MVHIYLQYKSGFCSIFGGADWSIKPSNETLLTHYKNNKNKYKVGYIFTIEGLVVEVNKITETSKEQIIFSMT
jgi:hypothetical protein